MITTNNRIRSEGLLAHRMATTLQHFWIYPQVRHQDALRPCKIKDPLFLLIDGPHINGPVKLLPAIIAIPKLCILPFLMPIVIDPPTLLRLRLNTFLHMLINLPRAYEPNVEPVKGQQIILIQKSTVHSKNDGHIRPI